MSSPNSSEENPCSSSDSLCLICDNSAHGSHFGVLSCRACAAFFRRTHVLKKRYDCRRGGSCDISKTDRYFCRSCRLSKCLQKGMIADNVQLNRDLNSTVETPKDDEPFAKYVREIQNEFHSINAAINRNKPDEVSNEDTSPHQDYLQKLRETAVYVRHRRNEIFNTFNAEIEFPEVKTMNILQKLVKALNHMHRYQQQHLELKSDIDMTILPPFWERHYSRFTEVLMFLPDFVELSFEDKVLFNWKMASRFLRMERGVITVKILGERAIREKLMVFDDKWCMRFPDLIAGMGLGNSSKLQSVYSPPTDEIYDKILSPLQKLNLTDEEAAYLLCQTAFHVEEMDMPPTIVAASLSIRNKISDDIHKYYIEKGTTNYVMRLMEIMDVLHAFELCQSKRARMIELAKLFDVITCAIDEEDNSHEDPYYYVPSEWNVQ